MDMNQSPLEVCPDILDYFESHKADEVSPEDIQRLIDSPGELPEMPGRQFVRMAAIGQAMTYPISLPDRALEYFEPALEGLVAEIGATDPMAVEVRWRLVCCLDEVGRSEDAIRQCNAMAEASAKLLGPGDALTCDWVLKASIPLLVAGKQRDADQILQSAIISIEESTSNINAEGICSLLVQRADLLHGHDDVEMNHVVGKLLPYLNGQEIDDYDLLQRGFSIASKGCGDLNLSLELNRRIAEHAEATHGFSSSEAQSAWGDHAFTLWADRDKPLEAALVYQRIWEEVRKNHDWSDRAPYELIRIAKCYSEAGDSSQAIMLYEEAIEGRRPFAEQLERCDQFDYAEALADVGRLEEAKGHFETVIRGVEEEECEECEEWYIEEFRNRMSAALGGEAESDSSDDPDVETAEHLDSLREVFRNAVDDDGQCSGKALIAFVELAEDLDGLVEDPTERDELTRDRFETCIEQKGIADPMTWFVAGYRVGFLDDVQRTDEARDIAIQVLTSMRSKLGDLDPRTQDWAVVAATFTRYGLARPVVSLVQEICKAQMNAFSGEIWESTVFNLKEAAGYLSALDRGLPNSDSQGPSQTFSFGVQVQGYSGQLITEVATSVEV